MDLPDSIRARVTEFLDMGQNDGASRLERFARKLSLVLSILKNPTVFRFFALSDSFLPQLLPFLCTALTSACVPVLSWAKKCFRILSASYRTELAATTQTDEFWSSPSKIFSFWGTQPDRIHFYTRLTKLRPEKTPPDVLLSFFSKC
jgi:hypothetical protein